METMTDELDQPRCIPELEARKQYAAYKRTYYLAEALYVFMFERWRNDFPTYVLIESVSQDSKYGIHVVNV